ncbi:MAG: proton glutamate symport protein, partial [Thalassolituus oleivorans]
MPWYKKLHWQIMIGLALGVVYGIWAAASGFSGFTSDWIAPFGDIFLNLLKLIAVPLIIVSLVTGVASLSDLKKLSRIGGKTIAIYMGTTVIALIIGLAVVNIMRPGDTVPPEMRDRLQETYAAEAESRTGAAMEAKERGPLQPIVDMVPDNLIGAAGDNRNMLQIVFVALFMGVGMLMIPAAQAKTLYVVFEAANDLVIKLVE